MQSEGGGDRAQHGTADPIAIDDVLRPRRRHRALGTDSWCSWPGWSDSAEASASPSMRGGLGQASVSGDVGPSRSAHRSSLLRGSRVRELPKTEAQDTRRLALPSIDQQGVRVTSPTSIVCPARICSLLIRAAPRHRPSRSGADPGTNRRHATGVDCTFHDLRHHAGTLTASAGASVRESMARLGHASPAGCAALPTRRGGTRRCAGCLD